MTPCLFPELDEDRRARAAVPSPEPEDPDDGLDPGPDRLLQARLPGAGFVRLIENPTPTLDLPSQTQTYIHCDDCGAPTESWVHRTSAWRNATVRLCFDCAGRGKGRSPRKRGW